jgi:hypothetical protein
MSPILAPISFKVNHLYGLLVALILLQISLVVVFVTIWLPTIGRKVVIMNHRPRVNVSKGVSLALSVLPRMLMLLR